MKLYAPYVEVGNTTNLSTSTSEFNNYSNLLLNSVNCTVPDCTESMNTLYICEPDRYAATI